MKTHAWPALILGLLIGLTSCNSSNSTEQAAEQEVVALTTAELADSIRYLRRNFLQSDFLSAEKPNLSREEAFAIQLEMLDQEVAEGAQVVGWKMGGTATADAAAFDPIFGYILDRYVSSPGSELDSEDFPGGSILIEGEIGFVIKDDLKQGVASKEELLAHIDHVTGAIELAKGTAIPPGDAPLDINYVLATGMGQVGTIKGTTEVSPEDFDFENETVKCYVNDSLVAEGKASNIYGNPLNALYELANLLPTQNRYLKAGDLVITGSVYQNPTVEGPAEVRVAFSSLGTISFITK